MRFLTLIVRGHAGEIIDTIEIGEGETITRRKARAILISRGPAAKKIERVWSEEKLS